MKTFFALREQQMSGISGGIAIAIVIGFCLAFLSAVGFGSKISAALDKAQK